MPLAFECASPRTHYIPVRDLNHEECVKEKIRRKLEQRRQNLEKKRLLSHALAEPASTFAIKPQYTEAYPIPPEVSVDRSQYPVCVLTEDERQEAIDMVRYKYQKALDGEETHGWSRCECAAALEVLSADRIYVLDDDHSGGPVPQYIPRDASPFLPGGYYGGA